MRPNKGGNIGQQGGKSKGAAFAVTSGGYGAAGAVPVAPGGGKRATIIAPTADHGASAAGGGSSHGGGSAYSGAAHSATASRRRAARREGGGGGGSIASKSQGGRSKGGAYPADAASASRHSGATSARRKTKRSQAAHGVPVANVTRRGKRKPAWRRWASYLAFLNKRSKRPSLSKRAVAIIGSFVEDMFETITMQGSAVARMNNRKTVQAKEIETAVRLILPEELSRIALAEGTRALTKYNASLLALKEADEE